MEVRRAERADLLGIGRVVHASCWETYSGLLKPSTISAVLETRYAPSVLKRRLLDGGLLVAVDEDNVVIGFAMLCDHPNFLEVEALFVDVDRRGSGIGRAMLETAHDLAPEGPLCVDVLLGSAEGESFQESLGFAPGEIIERDIAGEMIVERRWWRPGR